MIHPTLRSTIASLPIRTGGFRRSLSLAAAIAITAGTVGLSGCDRESAETKSIREATAEINRLTGSGAAAPRAGEAKTTFGKVSGDLANTKKSGASAIIAQSQIGLADIEFEAYRAREREALNKINLVLPAISLYGERHAIAQASQSFDPSPQLAEIDASRKDKQGLIEKVRADRAKVEQRVNELRDQAKAKLTASAAKQDDYSRMLGPTTSGMSATAAAPIVEQANRIRREADALRLEGARIEAQADEVSPQLNELQLIVDQYANQLKGLDAYEADLKARLTENRAAAEVARKDATDAAARIDQLVTEIADLRDKGVEEAAGTTAKKLNDAVRSAKQAQDNAAATAKVTTATGQQALGQLAWERTRGHIAYATLLERLAAAKPALPKAGDYRTAAEKARKDAEESLNTAKQAMEDAGNALRTIPISGPTASAIKERLQALADEIRDSTTKLSSPPAQAPEPAPAPAAAAPESPAAAGATEVAAAPTDPALTTFVEQFLATAKDGKYADLAGFIHTPNPSIKAALDAMLALVPNSLKLDAACKAKFGKSVTEAQKEMMGGQVMGATGLLDIGSLASVQAADVKIVQQGETASISHPALGGASRLTKVDGKWGISEPSLAMMAPMLPVFKRMGSVIDGITADVEAGKLTDIASTMQALQARVLQGATPPTPPGGATPPPGGG